MSLIVHGTPDYYVTWSQSGATMVKARKRNC